MSSIRLTKESPHGKVGQIISVPFGQGRELVASGIGEYPVARDVPAQVLRTAAPAIAERHAGEIDRLNETHAQKITELKSLAKDESERLEKKHAAEMKALQAELDAANARIAELNAKHKTK